MSCSIHSSVALSFLCSILFIRQISHLFRGQALSPLSLKPSCTFDFKQFMDSKAQRRWLILNDAEFKLFSQHHVLQVPRVKESGGHLLNWKIHQSLQDAIYHTHDLPHSGSLHPSWIPTIILRPLNSLHDCVRGHARWSSSALRGRGFLWDQVIESRESCTRSPQAVKLHGSDSDHARLHTSVGLKWRSIRVHVRSRALL